VVLRHQALTLLVAGRAVVLVIEIVVLLRLTRG